MDIREGRVIKGVAGSYTVYEDGVRYTCRARGRFRGQGVKPMVGDMVTFTPPTDSAMGMILDILPRVRELARPCVSNIGRLVAVVSAGYPQPDLMLVDRLLVDARRIGTEPILVINKADLADAEQTDSIACQYRGTPVLAVSARTGEGVDALARHLAGHIACFAGQSGVGKTSLLNRIRPCGGGEVGELSARAGRGRHTTRHTELIELPGGGWAADTPGFSLLETEPMDPGLLPGCYPEYAPFEGLCRFDDCRHDREKGCAVRRAVQEGRVHPLRYERYRQLMRELDEKWRMRYGQH